MSFDISIISDITHCTHVTPFTITTSTVLSQFANKCYDFKLCQAT